MNRPGQKPAIVIEESELRISHINQLKQGIRNKMRNEKHVDSGKNGASAIAFFWPSVFAYFFGNAKSKSHTGFR
ncbi:MAG: hypothetical protein IPN49_15915 [Saprospiraceae bacterium]|nr:hypothetical protein [Saprospiraceae bacterium]MBK9563639.1 hypothetical protein [Saprospiraceae bacterium]MBP6447684.1 hypothetical protein [Saprospiraceae bacterium]